MFKLVSSGEPFHISPNAFFRRDGSWLMQWSGMKNNIFFTTTYIQDE